MVLATSGTGVLRPNRPGMLALQWDCPERLIHDVLVLRRAADGDHGPHRHRLHRPDLGDAAGGASFLGEKMRLAALDGDLSSASWAR